MTLVTMIYAQPDKFAIFRETYRNELADAGIVGSSFVFVKDGKTIAEEHFGSANLEKNQAANADTIYHWASNTKPFTGIAICSFATAGC